MNKKDDFYDITQIINTSILQDLPDAFFNATGVTTGLHDLNGELITTIPEEDFCPFCRNMFYNPEGHKRCLESNRYGAKKALQNNGPYIYQCHAGLIDVAVPIIFEGNHIGTASCGQLIMNEPDNDLIELVRKRLSGFDEEFKKKQMEALQAAKIIPYERVEAISVLLQSIANEVIHLIIKNIREQKINKKNTYLIEEIKKRALLESEIKSVELRMKEAELKILEAQINPHFLYNTLDSIQWLAIIHEQPEIQNMIQSLGNVMRYSLMRGRHVVNVESEIAQIKDYFVIQKTRFVERLEFTFDIDKEVLKFLIPKLTIQPLVENAIKHGIDKELKGGFLWIAGHMVNENEALLSIENNGRILSEQEVQNLLFKIKNHEIHNEVVQRSDYSNKSGGIGLHNVHERLRFYFGEEYGLEIIAKKERTCFQFRIPASIRRFE